MYKLLTLMMLSLPVLSTGCKAGNSKLMGLSQPQQVKTIDPHSAPFVSGKKNRVYHTRHCQYAANLDSPAGFSTSHDAERSGKMPCQFCAPQSGAAQQQQ